MQLQKNESIGITLCQYIIIIIIKGICIATIIMNHS